MIVGNALASQGPHLPVGRQFLERVVAKAELAVQVRGSLNDPRDIEQILLDADLITGAPREQRFYTAMDTYIHGAEALDGTFINEFSRAYAEKSLALCREVFLEEVWELPGSLETRTVDNFIRKLRQALENDPSKPQHILSVRGAGYRFVA